MNGNNMGEGGGREEFGFEMIMTTHRYLLLRMNNNKKTDAPIDETKQKFAQT
jgi:hypothetical protein